MTSSETWAQRIREWRRSGMSAERFAKDRDFSGSALRIAEQRMQALAVPATAVASGKPALARVIRSVPVATTPPSALIVELGPGRVLVPVGCDESTLRVALAALRHLGGLE